MQKINNEKAYNCLNPWLVCFVVILYPDLSNYYLLEPKDCRSRWLDRHYGELKPDKEVKYYSIYKNFMIQIDDSRWRIEAIL